MRKLDEIVREYMIESLGSSQIDNRYARLLQIAITGLKDLYYDRPGLTKFTTITIEDNDTALLPNDYIDYVRIGVCFNGTVFALGENANMCPPEFDDCGNTEICQPHERTGSVADGYFYSWPYTENMQLAGKQWGVGGGNNGIGYYKVWPEHGFISLQARDTQFDSIILEYVADPEEIDGEFMVHEYDVEPIKAWMYWKYYQRNLNVALSQKEEARYAYGREKKKAMQRHGRFSANEFMQAIRAGYKSSPKL